MNSFKCLNFIISIFFTFPGIYLAQQNEINFTQITSEHGLSQNTIHSIAQDEKGFMWFGTEDGLNKYDGYNFTTYRNDSYNPNSISDNFIWCMLKDSKGRLWIGTNNGGLNQYNHTLNSFSRYQYNKENPYSISSNSIRVIFEDSQNRIWIGTGGGGLNLYDESRNGFINFKANDGKTTSISDNNIYTITEDLSGNIWIGTDQGIDRFDSGKNSFTKVDLPESINNINGVKQIRSLFFDNQNRLWIGSAGGGLICLDNFKFRYYSENSEPGIPNNFITDIYQDDDKRLWVCTEGGLLKLSDTQNSFEVYKSNPMDMKSLSANLTRTVFEDRAGVIWIGTVGGGINKIKKEYKKLGVIRHNPSNPNSLSFDMIRSIFEDKNGILWIGTLGGGLNRFDKQKNEFIHFKHIEGDSTSLSNDGVTSIYETSNGDLWIGTWGGGLNRLTSDERKRINDGEDNIHFEVFVKNEKSNSLVNNIVQAISEDKYGNLWIGTEGGLDYFNVEKKLFHHLGNVQGPGTNISDKRIQSKCIIEDKRGRLWVGTWNGLNLLRLPDNYDGDSLSELKFENYRHDPAIESSLGDSRVISIYEDADTNIWIGTHGGGLNLLDGNIENGFVKITESNGLSSNVIYGIEGDNKNRLWLSTNNGIIRYSPDDKTIRNYLESDGFQSNQFFYGASFKGKSGILYFGGVNGLNYFHPEDLKDNPHVPPIYITEVTLFNKPLRITDRNSPLKKSITETKNIKLPYDDYIISFEFVALDYTNPERNQYKYMLEGYDNDWIPANTRRHVTYSNISDGEYTFRVKGSNSDAIWNEEGVSLAIVVQTPFWKSWWFIVLAALTIIGIVVYIVATQIRNLIAVERLRTKLAADLHDNIGSSLTEIAILSEVISTRLKDAEDDVLKSLSMISDNSRKLIDKMSDIVWLVNPKRDSLYDLILRLEDNYSEILSQTKISFRSENLRSLEKISLPMEHRQHLFLIFKEGINNSISHGECTEIVLNANIRGKTLKMELSDNGKGFDSNLIKRGNGLHNMQERARKIGGKLEINSSEESGTLLRFTGNI